MSRRFTRSTSLLLALGLAAAGCATEANPDDEALPTAAAPAPGGGQSPATPEAEATTLSAADALAAYPQDPDRDDYLAPASEANDRHAETAVAHDARSLVDSGGVTVTPGPILNGLPPSCNAADLKLTTWPLNGTTGRNWLVNNYVDLDPGAALTRDWMNNTGSLARTYDGHRGMDVDISSFREMDAGTMMGRAPAPGVVEDLDESQYDRNTSCTGNWNFVKIRQANGFAIFYGHVKTNSVVVNVGDSVVAGQMLAVVGSAGCSTQPHLHFEVQDCANVAIEPNLYGMWVSPPAYNAPSDVMDVMLRKDQFAGAGQIKDPIANPTLYAPGETLGIGLSMAGKGGDTVQLSLIAPDATTDSWTWNVPGVARYTHMYPSWWKTVGTTVGTWTLRVYVNGSLKATRSFGVSNYQPGWGEVARHGVPAGSYQTVFTDITTAGYRPVWVDGFDVGGNTYFNAVFRPTGGKAWVARHNLDAAGYQNEFNTWTGAGYRVTQVDSYLAGGSVRYAVIFTKEAGPAQVAYHGASEAAHQASFNSLAQQGYHAVNVSVVDVGGARQITALYELANVGGWVALHGIPAAQYQTEFTNQKNAGRHLKYLNAYTLSGQVYYSAIWDSLAWGASEAAVHGNTSAQYQTTFTSLTGQGYLTRFVTGVGVGGTAYYAALWSK
jgi:murein DD-endopeptidase MepM/ murein hydrolase activator NlpD